MCGLDETIRNDLKDEALRLLREKVAKQEGLLKECEEDIQGLIKTGHKLNYKGFRMKDILLYICKRHGEGEPGHVSGWDIASIRWEKLEGELLGKLRERS